MKVMDFFLCVKTNEADLRYGNPIFKCRLRFTDGRKREVCFDQAKNRDRRWTMIEPFLMINAFCRNMFQILYIYKANQESIASY